MFLALIPPAAPALAVPLGIYRADLLGCVHLSGQGSVPAPRPGQQPSLLPSPCLLGDRERPDLLSEPGAVLRISLFRSLARSHIRV